IVQHEWQFLFGRSIPKISGWRTGKLEDALYVKGDPAHTFSMIGVGGTLRFRSVRVPRNAILLIWPRRLEHATARVGLPWIMNQLELELDQWIAGGFQILSSQMQKHGQGGKKTITAVAAALEDWSIKNGLKPSADDEPQRRTIENSLRNKLRRAVESL